MSFYDVKKQYDNFDFEARFKAVTEQDVLRAIAAETCSEDDLFALLSEKAQDFLEPLAQKSHALTMRHFGRVICLYAPLYLSNICDNECVYCGFKHSNHITRRKLSLEAVEVEGRVIAAQGIRHLLILTGESRVATPVSYIRECVVVLKKYFPSVSIEVYPLEQDEYAALAAAGVDGMTIYQETYDEALYPSLHLKGLKRNYRYRLETPDRACSAKLRTVGIGALLGLADFKKEAFLTLRHAKYLQDTYPDTEISVSPPRIQPQVGNFAPTSGVTDRQLVQMIVAARLFIPRAGVTVSTRESSEFRRNILRLGVTRMSAGSRTEVGGYTKSGASEGQFEVADGSSVEDVKKMIYDSGYQPVFKDWQTV